MRPKPEGWGAGYAAWFQDAGIVAAYPNRPPYPPDTFATLAKLLAPGPRVVLDAGCGTGDLARHLAPLVERVDAVDRSAAMLARGQRLPGGQHEYIRWLHSAAEDAPLSPPYALITTGESLHWMQWDVVLPRFARALAPGGYLAIVERDWDRPPALRERLHPLFRRYSANTAFRPHNLIEELTSRGLFAKVGERSTGPAPWRPTVAEYIECRHSQNGFSRERMAPGAAEAFDAALRELLCEACASGLITEHDGRLDLSVEALVVWGTPLDATAA